MSNKDSQNLQNAQQKRNGDHEVGKFHNTTSSHLPIGFQVSPLQKIEHKGVRFADRKDSLMERHQQEHLPTIKIAESGGSLSSINVRP
ncbi:MAG TPA: hypothetical protein V6D17_17105 [Candidatus Obscuribacterales bacterium]